MPMSGQGPGGADRERRDPLGELLEQPDTVLVIDVAYIREVLAAKKRGTTPRAG